MSHIQSIPCLFSKNGTNGNRNPAEKITPGMVIGFMDATPWRGRSRDERRKDAVRRMTHFVEGIYSSHEAPFSAEAYAKIKGGGQPECPLENSKICSYASPERVDVEDKLERIAKSRDLEKYQEEFAKQYLLPLVSKHEGESVNRISVEAAKRNMRISLIGFSYGGIFIAGVRKALIGEMKTLGYDTVEIGEIFSQIYQVNIGVQRTENDSIEPKFRERNLIVRGDTQGVWESWIEHDPSRIIPLENDAFVLRPDGGEITKPHSQYMYSNAIAKRPDLRDEIRHSFESSHLENELADLKTENDRQFVIQRINEASYRQQMHRR